MASGHVNRTQRPNTWLHRPTLRREDFLANSEPSTHGPSLPRRTFAFASVIGGIAAAPASERRASF